MKRLLYIIYQQLTGSHNPVTDSHIKAFLIVPTYEGLQHYTPFVFIAHCKLKDQTVVKPLRTTRNLGTELVTFYFLAAVLNKYPASVDSLIDST